jgi:hypothetical protein
MNIQNQNVRMSAADYRKLMGATVAEKPQIRLPKAQKMNKTEASFELYLRSLWLNTGVKIIYEPITLRLPSGTKYTPDFLVIGDADLGKIIEIWEVKGPHIHSAASLRAFKEARSAFPFWKFKFAQRRNGAWTLAE